MRVYFDEVRNVIVVAKAGQAFAPKSLSVTYANGKVTLWQADAETKVVSRLPFQKIRTRTGAAFGTVQQCVAYLEDEFSKPQNEPEIDYLASVMEILN